MEVPQLIISGLTVDQKTASLYPLIFNLPMSLSDLLGFLLTLFSFWVVSSKCPTSHWCFLSLRPNTARASGNQQMMDEPLLQRVGEDH